MTRRSDVADDSIQDIKAQLDRWASTGSLREHETFVAVWCALEQEGFSDIRLRREPYELPHNLWRFSVRRSNRHTTFLAIEGAVRRACKSLGHPLTKDGVAAMVCGPRARGVFILPGPIPCR